MIRIASALRRFLTQTALGKSPTGISKGQKSLNRVSSHLIRLSLELLLSLPLELGKPMHRAIELLVGVVVNYGRDLRGFPGGRIGVSSVLLA